MAWQWTYTGTPDDSVNLSPATGSVTIYILKQALKQAGWTVLASSDGTTYNSSGDQITSGNSGAGGMANSKAWFRIRTPEGSGGREFTFQRGTSDTVWRFKLSHSSGFTTGGSSTDTPSATDEAVYHGGGTDVSPTFTALFTTNGLYKAHIGADNTAPYNAYMMCVNNGGATATTTRGWWFINMKEDSHSPLDIAPYIVNTWSTSLSGGNMASGTSPNGGNAWIRKGMEGEAFLFVRAGQILGSYDLSYPAFPRFLGKDLYDNSDILVPIPYYRTMASDTMAGWKGWLQSDVMCWPGAHRAKGEYTDVGLKRYAYWDEIALIFPQSVVPIV